MAKTLSKHNEQQKEILKLYNQAIVIEMWKEKLINIKNNTVVATVGRQTIVDKIIEYHLSLNK